MLDKIKTENILFLDIETVSGFETYDEIPERLKEFWDKKTVQLNAREGAEKTPEQMYERAGIFSEFGKIVCISVGLIVLQDGKKVFRQKSFFGDEEKKLLKEFAVMLNNFSKKNDRLLCAHNGKEFDFPYIARRMLINGIKLPKMLDLAGKKPWEVPHLDTMELWKFGDYKHYTSLGLLTAIFDIPTPKDDIDGSQVGKVYWQDKDLERIATYCQKDVLAIAQLFLRYKNEDLISDECIEIAF